MKSVVTLILALATAGVTASHASTISVSGSTISYTAQLREDPQLRPALVPCQSGLCEETYCVAVLSLDPPINEDWLILTGKMATVCLGQVAGACLQVAGVDRGPTFDFSGHIVQALVTTSAAAMKPINCPAIPAEASGRLAAVVEEPDGGCEIALLPRNAVALTWVGFMADKAAYCHPVELGECATATGTSGPLVVAGTPTTGILGSESHEEASEICFGPRP